MSDNNDSELKRALRDAERRYQIATEKYLGLSARMRDAGESNTIPARYNHEWSESLDELEAALAALIEIQGSILGQRST